MKAYYETTIEGIVTGLVPVGEWEKPADKVRCDIQSRLRGTASIWTWMGTINGVCRYYIVVLRGRARKPFLPEHEVEAGWVEISMARPEA